MGEISWTYGDVRSRSLALAGGMIAMGVRPGDRIGVLANNGIEWLLIYMATAYLGATLVPVHTRYTPLEIGHVLRQSEVSTLFIGGRYQARLFECDPGLRTADGRAIRSGELPQLARLVGIGGQSSCGVPFEVAADGNAALVVSMRYLVQPTDRLLIKYTSGSTRAPKGVMLLHGNVLRNATNVGQRLGMSPDDLLFSALPFYHAGGSILSVLMALSYGACVVTLDHFDSEMALDAIERHRCTVHIGMDVMYLKMASSPSYDKARIASLRTGWITASPEVARLVYEKMPFRFVNLYGMTELSGNCCMTRPDDPDQVRLEWAGEAQPGLEVGIFDPVSGGQLPAGKSGEIRVRGWGVMDGYYRDEAATAQAIDSDGWLRTGDSGFLGPSGYLKFTGREKDMLKVGGENVSASEIEACLQAHPRIRLAQVVSVPDATYGEVPFAFVELASGIPLTEDELIAHCARELARFKVPRYFRIIKEAEWPMTGPEKIQKFALRARAIAELETG
jgi:fatty-acyl-CoA synthase